MSVLRFFETVISAWKRMTRLHQRYTRVEPHRHASLQSLPAGVLVQGRRVSLTSFEKIYASSVLD
jgi:hypothetical protein